MARDQVRRRSDTGAHSSPWLGALWIVLVGGLVLAAQLGAPGTLAQVATQPGPDGTPQFDRAIERRPYIDAGRDELLTYGALVQQAAHDVPLDASPEAMKKSTLRSRLLDLRLMVDFNAFLYEPDQLDTIRARIDDSYELIGLYKDLFDQEKLTGVPPDPVDLATRGAAMNGSLQWLRDPAQRQEMIAVFRQPHGKIRHLDHKDLPRLWRIAGVSPVEGKSSLATVAQLCGNVLAHLVQEGLLVDDVLDAEQEASFHDVRKALRSVLILVDMFPTAATVVGESREPLSRLVDAYGAVNDASIAYHTALAAHRDDLDERREDLLKAYKQAKHLAELLVESGQLSEYVTRLTPLQLFNV